MSSSLPLCLKKVQLSSDLTLDNTLIPKPFRSDISSALMRSVVLLWTDRAAQSFCQLLNARNHRFAHQVCQQLMISIRCEAVC